MNQFAQSRWSHPFQSYEYWADLAEQTPPFLIENFVHIATNTLSGKPSTGKTRLAAAIAAAVANGDEEFCGRKINDHGPVMIVSTDAGESRQWGARMREHNVKPGMVGIARFNRLDWRIYQEAARTAKLFIVDNLMGVLGARDVGDNSAAYEITEPLAEIAENGCTVLMIAHSGKNFESNTGKHTPTGVMGSTAYGAWERMNIHMHDANEPNVRYLKLEGNDAARQDFSLAAKWGRSSASWSMLAEMEDKRPRTEETHARRLTLFEEVMNDPELSKVKGVNEIGRQLYERFPERWKADGKDWHAAKTAFSRARKAVAGEFIDGRWQAGGS